MQFNTALLINLLHTTNSNGACKWIGYNSICITRDKELRKSYSMCTFVGSSDASSTFGGQTLEFICNKSFNLKYFIVKDLFYLRNIDWVRPLQCSNAIAQKIMYKLLPYSTHWCELVKWVQSMTNKVFDSYLIVANACVERNIKLILEHFYHRVAALHSNISFQLHFQSTNNLTGICIFSNKQSDFS